MFKTCGFKGYKKGLKVDLIALKLTSRCPHSKGIFVDGLDQVVGQVNRLQFSHPLKGEGLHRGYGIA